MSTSVSRCPSWKNPGGSQNNEAQFAAMGKKKKSKEAQVLVEPEEQRVQEEDQDSLQEHIAAFEEASDEIVVTEKMKQHIRDAERRAFMVDLEALIQFIFPPELQHTMSTGRLFAFGFYGPLDESAQLRSGHRGQHVVSCWELDSMCKQFEREDILQVYMSDGRSASALSEEQAQEILAQADARLKVAKGKAMMKQITAEEVRQLFQDLPADRDGLLNFHDMQLRIIQYRNDSVKNHKVIFPHLTPSTAHTTSQPQSSTQRSMTRRKRVPRRNRTNRVSAEVAPPEMFEQDRGMNSMEVANYTNKLLSTRAYQIADIAQGNSSELTANVRLVRQDIPYEAPASWDIYCMKKGSNMGALVRSAKSSTTSKRKTTLY